MEILDPNFWTILIFTEKDSKRTSNQFKTEKLSSKSTLIVLTASFPYGKAETFLEDEIPVLAKEFDAVVIVTRLEIVGAKRLLPENCVVIPMQPSAQIKTIVDYIKVFFNGVFWSELFAMCFSLRLFPKKGRLATAWNSLIFAQKTARFLEQELGEAKLKTSIGYSYWLDDSAIALALLKMNRKMKTAVARMHGWDVYFERSAVGYLPYRPFLLNQLDAVFSISEQGKSYSQNRWARDSSKIKVARLGVQLTDQDHRRENRRLLVSVSNVIPLKRVDWIASALMQIKEPVEWVHFGDGSGLEALQALVTKSELAHHSIDLKGRVSKAEVLKFYADNQPGVFINVSTTEGIPVSIMEAMSYGIPVVATNVGGTSELVNETNGILLLKDCSINELAEAINSFMSASDIQYLSAGIAARGTIIENYSAEKNYTDFAESLKRI